MRRSLMKVRAFVVLAVSLLSLTSCENSPSGSTGMVENLPTPSGTRIVTPAKDVPTSLAAFSGIWGGRWRGVSYGQDWAVDSLVIVERIGANGDVRGTYVLGDAPPYLRAGSWKFSGKIADGKLTWTWGTSRLVYSMERDGILSGRRYISDVQDSAQITMRKMEATADAATPPASLLASIEIGAPDPTAPPAATVFIGRWEGVTSSGRERIMAVTRVTSHSDASVMHAWDDASRPEGFKPNYYTGSVENGVLSFSGGGDRYEFRMTPDGTLNGIVLRNGTEQRWGAITMRRVP